MSSSCSMMNNITSDIEYPPVLRDLGEMAAKLAYYNFEWRYITLVLVLRTQMLIPLQSFLASYDKSVIIKLEKFIPYFRPVQQFVLFAEDSEEIIKIIQWLNRFHYNTAGKFVIICTAVQYDKCDEKHVFKILSERNIVNVLFLRGDTDNTSLTFSYEKVTPGECKNNVPDVTQDMQIGCFEDECFQSKFAAKFRNFYKCPFIVSTFEQPPFMYLNGTKDPSGEDGSIITLLANVLNATLVIKIPENGNEWGRFENNNWTGSLGDVYNGIVDVSACSIPLTANKYGNFQISFVYNSMDIVWSARLPLPQPPWEKLLHPFKMFIRIILFLLFMVIVVINFILRTSFWNRIRKCFNIGPPKYSLLFYSWAHFLGVPTVPMPSNTHIFGVVFTWIWFCFIMRSCYQAALISSLKSHVHDEMLPNFKSVLESKYPYGGLASLREYYANDERIYKNWITLDFEDVFQNLDEIGTGMSDFVMAYNKEVVNDYLIKSNGSRNLQIVPEKIVNSPTVMFFKKHSPIVARVNQILSGSLEAGLTQLAQSRLAKYKKYFFRHLEEHISLPLTYDHISGCVYLLVFGWVLSIIFFIVEIYCGRYKH